MKKIILNNKEEIILNFKEEADIFTITIKDKESSIRFELTQSMASEISDYFQYQIYENELICAKNRIDKLQTLSLKLKNTLNHNQRISHFSTKGSNKHKAEVFIGLPQEEVDIFTIEKIQNACGEFMEVLGFQLETEDQPIYGSFFQRLVFWTKNEKTNEEVKELYQKGKKALEYRHLDKPMAEATSQLTIAASQLISSVKDIDEAVLRLGSILLVKIKRDGQTLLVVETVSHELAHSFDSNPNLMRNPNAVYELLIGERNKQGNIGEGENLTV